jgi:hypothetical protein
MTHFYTLSFGKSKNFYAFAILDIENWLFLK